jgi:hypothetical protein
VARQKVPATLQIFFKTLRGSNGCRLMQDFAGDLYPKWWTQLSGQPVIGDIFGDALETSKVSHRSNPFKLAVWPHLRAQHRGH